MEYNLLGGIAYLGLKFILFWKIQQLCVKVAITTYENPIEKLFFKSVYF